MSINKKIVNKIFYSAPEDKKDEVIRIMDLYGEQFGIKTDLQYIIFYSQILAEVGTRLKIKSENMNYSVSRLRIFKIFRKNPILAKKYGRRTNQKANQIMIGNYAYANRLGNGDVKSGDGWRYRGRGLIQITGRKSYRDVSNNIKKILGIDFMLETFPDAAGTDTGSVISTLGYWNLRKLYNTKTSDEATRIINYYTDSYAKRRRYFNKVKNIVES